MQWEQRKVKIKINKTTTNKMYIFLFILIPTRLLKWSKNNLGFV